jgi:glycosyltransferase involved in cell wall biosynthesis
MADMIIFSSFMERRDSVHERQFSKSTVDYHPVFDELAEQHPPRVWPVEHAPLRVGFLGRFHPKKNLELLIEAVAKIPGVRLEIAGDGPDDYRARLSDLVDRSGLSERVSWLGFISSEDLKAFFNSIDVLAMPSSYECFGLSAAEAMIHGVPVIVSDATGVSELVARYKCGFIVTAETESLCGAIEKLRASPTLLEDFSRQSIHASQQELSFDTYGDAMVRIYTNVIEKTA